MADRRVKVVFSAEVAGFKKAMEEAAQATKKTAKASEESAKAADTYLGKMVQSANKNRDEWERAGATMLGFGAAAVGGLALAGKAAMDWESAWAGVTKTVDGTPQQMDELEASLRGLAKTLPATHEEIAGVAEAAGQLGVARKDVVGFTETMIALGESTNLTADEAATSIAQISNVMGTMARDGAVGVERFGATLVALGNAGASTEKEILEMAKRIAGAGKLVGATESDVLALSNALASVGIEAQLGGGVMSRVMQGMYKNVKDGGDMLDNLAKVAGVSAKEFATAFETDPVRAVDMMVKGLSRVKEEGGNVVSTMSDIGISGTEETSVILRLAGAEDLLAESLKLGDEAWASNSALAAEAAKRYETTESKVKIAWNNIKDAAIDAGAVLLPMIAGIAEGAAGLASAFGSLPDPVKGVLTVLGGVAGVAALGAGAFLTLTPKILDTIQAFDKLAPAGGRARGAIAGVGKAAGAATAAIVGFEVIKGLHNSMQAPTASLEKFTQALIGIDKEKGSLDSLFADIGAKEFEGDITSAGDAINRLVKQDFNSAIESFGASIGVDNGMAKLADGITKVDQAIASAVGTGEMELAAKGFKSIADAAKEKGTSLEDTAKKFPEYLDSLRKLASDSKVALTEQELLNWAMGETPAAMEAAAAGGDKAADGIKAAGDSAGAAVGPTEEVAEALAEVGVSAEGTVTDLVKFTEALFNAGLLQLSARDAARGFEEAIDAMSESLKTNGSTLDITTEKGRANEAALDAIAGAGFRSAGAMAANGASQEELQANLAGTYDSLVAATRKFTETDEQAVILARDIMQIPDDVSIESWMSDAAKRMAEGTTGALNAVDGRVVTVTTIERTIRRIETQVIGGGYADDPSMTALDPGGHATGGKLRGFSDGGKLPSSGPGTEVTDGFLGINSAGTPVARLDKDEWIINGPSSNRYNRELAAINAGTFPKLPGYATGGMFSAGSFAGSSGGGRGGSVDASAVAAAVAGAMSGWQPVVNIGGREFHGLMTETTAKARRR